MQPTYLPWPGYFNLIASVDQFVILDDVQFARRSWQQRNRILIFGKEHILTIPVKKASQDALLCTIEISDHIRWRHEHLRTIVYAYANAPHGKEVIGFLSECFEDIRCNLLSEFNRYVIERIARRLDITTPFHTASGIMCGGRRSEHLARLCRAVGCSDYLSPIGAREYLEDDDFVGNFNLGLTFQNYQLKPYPQYRSAEFVSHMSIVDMVANIGWVETRRYIDHGRQNA
jgi:hypothetical protein